MLAYGGRRLLISRYRSTRVGMLFDITYSQLGWPKRDAVLQPSGAGPRHYTDLVEEKIKKPLQRFDSSTSFRTGVLSADPSSKSSDAPLAILCEFDSEPQPRTLLELHRLAWNFCHSPLLITLEPGLVRAWNCCEKPPDSDGQELLVPEYLKLAEHAYGKGKADLAEQAAMTLHWVNLITGDFLRRKEAEGRVKPEHRADRMLLDNLKFIRNRLVETGVNGKKLSQDTCHDLLARVIFVQFLCERKDSGNKPALGPPQFAALHEQRKFSKPHESFAQILTNKADTYELFRFLDRHFNGDLFPGKSLPRSQRKAAWQREMNEVQPDHLLELAKLLDGRLQAENDQLCLWQHYSFDTIPLEFISSIYEEFVTKRKEAEQEAAAPKSAKKKEGVVYTPGHLVDFVLDRVLPWGEKEWNLKVLDPSCGSGIFLVKAFQRLMHRWRLRNPNKQMEPKIPRRVLERNLFGVDIDPDAVRVASFSLYLAMLDELDPKVYFKRTKFPNLYRRRLVHADFFGDACDAFKTASPVRNRYDLVIGNVPWGEDMMTETAATWAKTHEWPVADKNIGPLFLAKALTLTKTTGRVAMLEPAGALLVNYNSPEFRKRLFSEFKLEAVFNFSPLSRVLFERADSPCALVVLRPVAPDGEPFYYCSPKRQQNVQDKYRIIVDSHDGYWVYQNEVVGKDEIWPALMWGGRRELRLIRDVSSGESLSELHAKGHVFIREGFIRGDRKKKQEKLKHRKILEADDFPESVFLHLRASALAMTDDLMVHSRDSTNFRAFELPQLIIKSSWTKQTARFRAVSVVSDLATRGVICKQSYVSVSAEPGKEDMLEAACLLFNSKLAVYLLLLKSGRFAFYRTEPLVSDLLTLSLPPVRDGILEGLNRSFKNVDERVREAFKLEDAEWALVEDLCEYTLPDYRGDASSPGYQPTSRKRNPPSSRARPGMAEYCHFFMNVLRAGFGEDKAICATVYHESGDDHLPVRLVAIHLDLPGQELVRSESLSSEALCGRLSELAKTLRTDGRAGETNYMGRTTRIYSFVKLGGRRVPTVFLVKPDQQRYWTRSVALRDADAVTADIMTWRNATVKSEAKQRRA